MLKKHNKVAITAIALVLLSIAKIEASGVNQQFESKLIARAEGGGGHQTENFNRANTTNRTVNDNIRRTENLDRDRNELQRNHLDNQEGFGAPYAVPIPVNDDAAAPQVDINISDTPDDDTLDN